MSLQSNIANNQLALALAHNFKVSRNIPIDTRFLVKDLNNLDVEIPLRKRHNGLIFFVTENAYTHGPADKIIGKWYCFEDDLTKPIPLYDVWDRYEILQINGYRNNTWANVINDLNLTFPKNGRCVFIRDLNIFVVYYEKIWYYVSGEYNIEKDSDWVTLPASLKVPERIVRIGAINPRPLPTTAVTRIVMNDKSLGVVVIPLSTLPAAGDAVIQNNHYYLIDGLLYIYLDGKYYRLNDDIYIHKLTNVQPGAIQVNHGLQSNYIIAFIRINNGITTATNQINPQLPRTLVIPVDCEILNNNTIKIENHLAFTDATIMVTKKYINL